MKVKELNTKYNDIYILAISDVHIGDKGFTQASENMLKSNIEWVKKTPNAYIILNGDILNVATRTSPSNPLEQKHNLTEQLSKAVELLTPVKNRILGAIDGNHESRLSDYVGFSPTISICDRLGIDYLGTSAVYIIRMEKRDKSNRGSFSIYTHHTTGGGRKIGNKLNRINMLREIVSNCDIYLGSHNHALAAAYEMTQVVNVTTGKVDTIKQMIVDTGSYVEWNEGYAERMMLSPSRLGSPILHLTLKQKKVNGKSEVIKDVSVKI